MGKFIFPLSWLRHSWGKILSLFLYTKGISQTFRHHQWDKILSHWRGHHHPWDKILSHWRGHHHPWEKFYPTGVATTTPGISSYPMVVVIIHAKMMYLTQVDLRYL